MMELKNVYQDLFADHKRKLDDFILPLSKIFCDPTQIWKWQS